MSRIHSNHTYTMTLNRRYLIFVLSLAFLPQNLPAADTDPAKDYASVEERRIDTSIIEERENIRKEREEIALRKKDLKTLEEGVDKKLTEMDGKLEELRKLHDKIETLLAGKSAIEKKKVQELASIYQKMSPDKAALAIGGLDQQLAADLLANMNVKAAAKILDQISKQKATELSTTFSTLQLE